MKCEETEKEAAQAGRIIAARRIGQALAGSVNPVNLPYVMLRDRYRLPQSRGVYFAIDGCDRILYIGQSVNIRSRWIGRNHKIANAMEQIDMFMRIAYLEIPAHREYGYLDSVHLTSVEKALIWRFKPKMNGIADLAPSGKSGRKSKAQQNILPGNKKT